MSAEVRFIADSNVGRLAKWLRVLGYDTLFMDNKSDDNRLVRLAHDEGRVILTRDTHILERRIVTTGQVPALLIQGDDLAGQLRQVVAALELDLAHRAFSRCIECNQPLEPREKAQVRALVPPYVFRTQKAFAQCPQCGRIYWQGTHWRRMRQVLEELSTAAPLYGGTRRPGPQATGNGFSGETGHTR